MSILIRLIQSLPLCIALAVLAVVVYLFVSWQKSPTRAKEVLIRLFLVLTGALSALFAFACVYAAIERNMAVLEFFGAFLVVAAVALLITLVCRARFNKNHPNYSVKRTRVRTISDLEASIRRILDLLKGGPFDPRSRR